MIISLANYLQYTCSADAKLNQYVVGKMPVTGVPNKAVTGPQLVMATDWSVQELVKKQYREVVTVWLELWYMPKSELDHMRADEMTLRLTKLIDKTNTPHDVNIRVMGRSLVSDPESAQWRRRIVVQLTQQ